MSQGYRTIGPIIVLQAAIDVQFDVEVAIHPHLASPLPELAMS